MESYLSIDTTTLTWRLEAPAQIDVELFDKSLESVESAQGEGEAPSAQASSSEALLELYRGDLADGLDAPWITPERERLKSRFVLWLEARAGVEEAARAYPEAIKLLEHLLTIDPLREESYRRLMRLYAQTGDLASVRTT